MCAKLVPLSALPTKVLLIFADQYQNDPYRLKKVLREIRKRFDEYPLYQLCSINRDSQNKDVKRLCNEVLCEQLPGSQEMIEVHSLQQSIQSMSLHQLCDLLRGNCNEIVDHYVRCELNERSFELMNVSDQEQTFQKIKRRKKHEKHKRR